MVPYNEMSAYNLGLSSFTSWYFSLNYNPEIDTKAPVRESDSHLTVFFNFTLYL